MARKLWLLALVVAGAFAFFALGLGRYLDLGAIRAHEGEFAALYAQHPAALLAGFFAFYVAVTALSLPGATLLTLAAGAVFGLGVGALLASFASSLGALLAFLLSRTLLRDTIERRYGARLAELERGIEKDGAFFLLSLRLLPVVPFFVINLVMGLTRIKAVTFYWVSQLGMLAATVVYVNAGTRLAKIRSLHDVVSPAMLISFALLALLPLLAWRLDAWLRARRALARWAHARPRRFERNLVVIGAGAAGLVSSYLAAAARARVTLVESGAMGGDCLNRGCVPSKALIHAASRVAQIRDAARSGVSAGTPRVDFAAVMERVAQAVREVAPHDSAARYNGLGVDVVKGRARILDPWSVEIEAADGTRRRLTTRAIVVATGATPALPELPGLAELGCLTSDTLWSLRTLPRRLLVLGGGAVGCELAQAFARLGSQVTLVEAAPRLLAREDDEVSTLVEQALRADGVTLLTGRQALRCTGSAGAGEIEIEAGGLREHVGFDQLLCAVGRVARLQGFGLEELGLVDAAAPPRFLAADACLQTAIPTIFVAGDVAGPPQLTHAAAHQAWTATVNALLGGWYRVRLDMRVMPAAVFVDPELARVGLNEREAAAQGVACEVTRFAMSELDRAIVDGATAGFVKVLTEPGRDRILGVTIVGAHAAELLAEYVLAMRHGLGLNKLLATVHSYPSYAEANKYAAGAWKRKHAPHRLLAWAACWHAWQRGGGP